jgi:hypothetical protein
MSDSSGISNSSSNVGESSKVLPSSFTYDPLADPAEYRLAVKYLE